MIERFQKYDIIVCDIDETLIYGFWTDLMRITWSIFRSNVISDLLMYLQSYLLLFKINWKLWYILVTTPAIIHFVTARKPCSATIKLLDIIMSLDGDYFPTYKITALQTDHPAEDKFNYVVDLLEQYPDAKICVFDDNKAVRDNIAALDIDTFDPVPMYEGCIK